MSAPDQVEKPIALRLAESLAVAMSVMEPFDQGDEDDPNVVWFREAEALLNEYEETYCVRVHRPGAPDAADDVDVGGEA